MITSVQWSYLYLNLKYDVFDYSLMKFGEHVVDIIESKLYNGRITSMLVVSISERLDYVHWHIMDCQSIWQTKFSCLPKCLLSQPNTLNLQIDPSRQCSKEPFSSNIIHGLNRINSVTPWSQQYPIPQFFTHFRSYAIASYELPPLVALGLSTIEQLPLEYMTITR